MATIPRATLDDLYRTEGKAELIGGRIVQYMATGIRPSEVASNIFVSLRQYARQTGRGRAFNDNLGYAIPQLLSGRESFSPDASYYDGPFPANRMRFVEGPPTFAVEVRSENDYGPPPEAEIAAKRADYFAPRAQIVWGGDPLAETVTAYSATSPTQLTVYRIGDTANEEPAVPGWRLAVRDLFSS